MTELKEVVLGDVSAINMIFEGSSSEETVRHVLNREWDCGIVILPVDAPQLEIIPLFRLPMAAAIHKSHRLAKRRTLKFEDLQNEKLIVGGGRRDVHFRQWLLTVFSSLSMQPRIVAEAASPHEAQYLVSRGVGIAVASSGAFKTSPEGVVVRLFPSELAQTQTALVFQKGKHPLALNAFIDRVVQIARARSRSRLPLHSAA